VFLVWHVLQAAIIVGLCYVYKTDIAPDRSIGHIFLFSVLVAYAVTWLLSKIIDLLALAFWRSRQFAQWLRNENGSGPLRLNSTEKRSHIRYRDAGVQLQTCLRRVPIKKMIFCSAI